MYFDGLFYHVYNRGAHRLPLFHSSSDYQYCLALVSKYRSRYQVSVLAYCLMPNHYHFLLRQNPDGSISRFIQTIFNTYTQHFNRRTRHSGTLFQGKAKRKLVSNEDRLAALARYIHLNPYRARLAAYPHPWPSSDFEEWCGKKPFTISLPELRDRFFACGDDYRTFVEELLRTVSLGPDLMDPIL